MAEGTGICGVKCIWLCHSTLVRLHLSQAILLAVFGTEKCFLFVPRCICRFGAYGCLVAGLNVESILRT